MARSINDASYWRAFEQNDITHSMAHYLMAIDFLRQEYGYARVTDVAEQLEVSRGAASMSISQLKKRGWVSEDHNRFLLLTEEGASIAHAVEHNYRILSSFFEQVLGMSRDVAHADACKMEHLMSSQTGQRLVALMRWVMSDDGRKAEVRKAMAAADKKNAFDCDHNVDSCPICNDEGDCLADAQTEQA